MKRYLKIWFMLTLGTAQQALSSRMGAGIFILGKIIRFLSFLAFIFLIGSRTKLLAGYTLWEMIIFFLTYNLIDTLTQLLFREVYRFRGYVATGDFDYFLTKPFSPLFRALFGGTDILDTSILIISVGGLFWAAQYVPHITFWSVVLYILLVINAFFIALAFHIIVLALAVVTTEVDNMIMLYRDTIQMGRVPVDFYTQPIRSILTFVIPVGIMMTVPAKALLHILSLPFIAISILITVFLVAISLSLWKRALAEYASASS